MPRSMHGFTYGGHTLSAAAAVATLNEVRKPAFLAGVRASGTVLLDRLRALRADFPCVGDARGVGLMLGVELVEPDGGPSPRLATALGKALTALRVITRVSEHGQGNVIELRPPLVLSVEDAHLVADRFGEALETL
jgi:4-aminobutyrate aminotransferase-like enzyme